MELIKGQTYIVHGKLMTYLRSTYSLSLREEKHYFATPCGRWNCNIAERELQKFIVCK